MTKCSVSLMACGVLIGTLAVAQQTDTKNPDAGDAALIQQLAAQPAAASNAAPAAVAEPDKPAEPPRVAEKPPAAAVEPAKAAEPAARPPEQPAANVLDDLLKQVPEKPAAAEAPKEAPPPAKIDVGGVEATPPPAAAQVAPPQDVAKMAAVEAKGPVGEKSSQVQELEALQQVTREAMQAHAVRQMERGDLEFKNGKFQDAVRFYEEAKDAFEKVGDREGNAALKERVYRGLGETYYNWARLLMKERNFVDAKQRARSAGTYWHPKTAEIMAEIEKAEKTEPEVRPVYPPARWRQKEFLTKEREIAARMKTGKQYFLTGEYDKSKDFYESVMREDPENTEAIRMLHKIMEIKERVAIQEREMTRDGMITDARKAWNRRDYAETGELGEMRTNTVGGVRPPPDEVVRQQILAKMEKIILPEIDFKQAFIRDVIDFLSKQSQEHDKAEADGASKGVNIVLNLAAGAQPKTDAAPAVSDPFVTQPPTGQAPAAGSENVNLITFQARGISLLEALKIVCSVANLKYRVEGSIVMVLPLDAPESKIVHRMYDVLPSFVTRMNEMKNVFGGLAGPGGAPGAPAPGAPPGGVGGEQDLKAMFAGFGIAWPQGSSIQHVPQIGKLIVANTVDNLATFEKVLGVLNVVPAQIEIEARFVEVRQTDIESLGFEWLLNDNWEIMQRRGMADLPANQRQRVVIGADSADGGMTSGNRFMRSGAMLPASAGNINDNLLHVSSVLTNPELTMILHAMQQKGNADLLSAPKVTTKTASEATIKVVREYIYPTEFTVTPIMGTTAGAGIATIVGGVVEPASFETREVGVILSVMPEVTPDGQMIDLTMTPQVVDEPEWENYGSEYTAPDGSVTRLPMRQPIFKSRSVQTSLSIYNGSTVVLGGMINEIRTAVDDKIPLLGDLPLIGRLFRSQYEHSDKRNLLIFVTARLVDPGGRAITPTEKTMNRLIPGLSQSSSK